MTESRRLPARPGAPTRPARQPNADRFTLARERAAANTAAYAGTETRERWYSEVSQLYLHNAHLNESGKFGPSWEIGLTEGSPDGTIITLSLRANGWRDRIYEALQSDLITDPTPIGPLALTKTITKNDMEAWDLIEWDKPAS